MFKTIWSKFEKLSDSQKKILAAIIMIIGIILLLIGFFMLGEMGESFTKYTVHESKGSSSYTSITFLMEVNHTYEVYIEIEASEYHDGVSLPTKTSATAEFYINDLLIAKRYLYDDSYDEEDPSPVSDFIKESFTPRSTSETQLEVILSDINADSWRITICKDKPPYIDVLGFLGVIIIFFGFTFTMLGLIVIIYKFLES
ncbi:MAG: hypothetical protein ACFFB5_10760 [Promethearchaeota archaeon]